MMSINLFFQGKSSPEETTIPQPRVLTLGCSKITPSPEATTLKNIS